MNEPELRIECWKLAVELARFPENHKDYDGVAKNADQIYNAVVKNPTSGVNHTLGLPNRDKPKGPR